MNLRVDRIAQRTGKDCLRCCVAMLLGLPYEAVPDPRTGDSKERILSNVDRWLFSELHGCVYELDSGYDMEKQSAVYPLLVCGKTERETTHCVVAFQGRIIDPHCSGAGLTKPEKHFALGHCALEPLPEHPESGADSLQHLRKSARLLSFDREAEAEKALQDSALALASADAAVVEHVLQSAVAVGMLKRKAEWAKIHLRHAAKGYATACRRSAR